MWLSHCHACGIEFAAFCEAASSQAAPEEVRPIIPTDVGQYIYKFDHVILHHGAVRADHVPQPPTGRAAFRLILVEHDPNIMIGPRWFNSARHTVCYQQRSRSQHQRLHGAITYLIYAVLRSPVRQVRIITPKSVCTATIRNHSARISRDYYLGGRGHRDRCTLH
jgi:hypothetical protein